MAAVCLSNTSSGFSNNFPGTRRLKLFTRSGSSYLKINRKVPNRLNATSRFSLVLVLLFSRLSLLFPQLPIDAEPKSMICPFTRENPDRLAAHRTGGRVWVRDAVAGAGIYRAGPGRPVFGRNLDVEEIEHAAATAVAPAAINRIVRVVRDVGQKYRVAAQRVGRDDNVGIPWPRVVRLVVHRRAWERDGDFAGVAGGDGREVHLENAGWREHQRRRPGRAVVA